MAAAPRSALVVGAGIAGLACARELARAGLRVAVVEKARGAGGRCTTRRRDGYAFDHGAQYLTARSASFGAEVEAWCASGAAARWYAADAGGACGGERAEARYVGVPGMSALGRHLASGLELRTGFRAVALEPGGGGWQVRADDGRELSGFDAAVVAAPAPQAVPLLAASPALAARAGRAELAPCLAALLAFPRALDPLPDALRLDGPVLAWAARNGSKPRRPAPECVVLHATPAWSAAHLEAPPDAIADALGAALADVLGAPLPQPVLRDAQRWRHALVTRALDTACLWDAALRLGACGDWCLGPRVELAFESGLALADCILARARGA